MQSATTRGRAEPHRRAARAAGGDADLLRRSRRCGIGGLLSTWQIPTLGSVGLVFSDQS